jgi:UDP-GlcNAc:undecaprenyl-phosphate GlcNAc-1-phosphate transferase
VDGVDGLATGLTLFLMLLLALLSGLGGNYFSLFLSLGMVGALAGFLYYNFPPAKIFLGDGGAYFLGVLIAELALLNSNKGELAVALIVPFFALGLPVIDTCFTIFRRGMIGLPIFRADRKHIHHRVIAMGFSRQRVVLLLYAVCGLFSLLALGVVVSNGRWLPLFFGLFMFVMIMSARVFGFVKDWYKVGRLLADSVVRRKHTKYALLLGQLLSLESERSRSVNDLWENFGFILEKLEFRTVQLKSADHQMLWKSIRHSETKNQRSIVQEIRSNGISEMVFTCDFDKWDEETLRLLSELSTEAWMKAVVIWERKH